MASSSFLQACFRPAWAVSGLTAVERPGHSLAHARGALAVQGDSGRSLWLGRAVPSTQPSARARAFYSSPAFRCGCGCRLSAVNVRTTTPRRSRGGRAPCALRHTFVLTFETPALAEQGYYSTAFSALAALAARDGGGFDGRPSGASASKSNPIQAISLLAFPARRATPANSSRPRAMER